MEVRPELQNASVPMVVNCEFSGKTTLVRLLQLSKVSYSIVVIPAGMVAEIRPMQDLKTPSPIVVTLAGIITEPSFWQL